MVGAVVNTGGRGGTSACMVGVSVFDGRCTVTIASDGSAAHLPVLWEFLCPIVGAAINTGGRGVAHLPV